MADSKISDLADGSPLIATDELVIARAGASKRVSGLASIGMSQLVYRYTVTGSDKASIDTGVDTPDAGSNDWTNGDLLEVFILARTDEAVVNSRARITLNNDGAGANAHYDFVYVAGINATASATNQLAADFFELVVPGASQTTGVYGQLAMRIAAFGQTVAQKVGDCHLTAVGSSGANTLSVHYGLNYRSTSAITRLKMLGEASSNFKVGSQLLIYKRLAS